LPRTDCSDTTIAELDRAAKVRGVADAKLTIEDEVG
jgi:hypothetical protein